jgi:hypothetical protein
MELQTPQDLTIVTIERPARESFRSSTNHVATARHVSERVFYPDTND